VLQCYIAGNLADLLGQGKDMSRARLIRWGGLAAILGGVLWILFYTGHTFTHGSTQSPRDATILGLESLDFNRLLALPPLLFIIGLFGTRATRAFVGRRPGRVAFVVALLGLVMITLGVILETWVIDPNKDFENPIVQGGWILFLFGLFPVIPVGMILYGIRSRDMERRLRILAVVIGLLAPLQWLEMFLSSVSTGSVVWDLAYSVLRGLFGLGWIVLGYVLWSLERLGVKQ
jgi:hypothetical protein